MNELNFFFPPNSIGKPDERIYQNMDILINAAKAFSRCTYQSVALMDHLKQKTIYTSDRLYEWLGYKLEDKETIDFQTLMNHIVEEDREMLQESNQQVAALFKSFSAEERLCSHVSCHFRLYMGQQKKLFRHSFTPIALMEDGQIWLSLCTASIPSESSPGHTQVSCDCNDFYYQYSFEQHEWIKEKKRLLNVNEREILILSAQGYTMEQIADYMCKSSATIKSNKQGIFSKLSVNSISEALSYAYTHKLI